MCFASLWAFVAVIGCEIRGCCSSESEVIAISHSLNPPGLTFYLLPITFSHSLIKMSTHNLPSPTNNDPNKSNHGHLQDGDSEQYTAQRIVSISPGYLVINLKKN